MKNFFQSAMCLFALVSTAITAQNAHAKNSLHINDKSKVTVHKGKNFPVSGNVSASWDKQGFLTYMIKGKDASTTEVQCIFSTQKANGPLFYQGGAIEYNQGVNSFAAIFDVTGRFMDHKSFDPYCDKNYASIPDDECNALGADLEGFCQNTIDRIAIRPVTEHHQVATGAVTLKALGSLLAKNISFLTPK